LRRTLKRQAERASDKRIQRAIKQSFKQGLELAREQGREVCQCAPAVHIFHTRAEIPAAVPATICGECGREKIVVKLEPEG
jgi:hypothetical protein